MRSALQVYEHCGDGRRLHEWRVRKVLPSGKKLIACRHCAAERWETKRRDLKRQSLRRRG